MVSRSQEAAKIPFWFFWLAVQRGAVTASECLSAARLTPPCSQVRGWEQPWRRRSPADLRHPRQPFVVARIDRHTKVTAPSPRIASSAVLQLHGLSHVGRGFSLLCVVSLHGLTTEGAQSFVNFFQNYGSFAVDFFFEFSSLLQSCGVSKMVDLCERRPAIVSLERLSYTASHRVPSIPRAQRLHQFILPVYATALAIRCRNFACPCIRSWGLFFCLRVFRINILVSASGGECRLQSHCCWSYHLCFVVFIRSHHCPSDSFPFSPHILRLWHSCFISRQWTRRPSSSLIPLLC